MQLFISNIFHSPHLFALSLSLIFFLITLLLVIRWKIRFVTSVLILISGLAISLVINYYQEFRRSFHQTSSAESLVDNQEKFSSQMEQAIKDLWAEIQTEKKQLAEVMHQVQEIVDSMHAEKIKLRNFIEETREQFQKQMPTPSDQNSSTTTSE